MIVAGIFLLIAFNVVASILNGIAVSQMWLWFVVPLLGVAPIGIPMAIGINILFSFFSWQYINNRVTEEEISQYIGIIILRPIVTIGVGFIVSRFL